jgi:tetratricopeptide (TPR) repeat protein
MPEPLHFDNIEKYLTGQLSAQEAAALEKAAESDAQLAFELQLQRLEHEAMNAMLARDLKRKMEAWWEEEIPSHSPAGERRISLNWRKPALLALIAAVLGGGIWVLMKWYGAPPAAVSPTPVEQPGEEKKAPQTQSSEPVAMPETKSSSEPPAPPLHKPTRPPARSELTASAKIAMEQYDGKNFSRNLKSVENAAEKSFLEQAAEALDKNDSELALALLSNEEQRQTASYTYLLGHTYFKEKDFEKASKAFRSLETDFKYQYQAQWYELLSVAAQLPRSMQRYEELMQIITSQTKNHLFKTKAEQLKEAISKTL